MEAGDGTGLDFDMSVLCAPSSMWSSSNIPRLLSGAAQAAWPTPYPGAPGYAGAYPTAPPGADAHAPAWGAAYPPPGRPPLASASQTRWQLLSNSVTVKQWSQFAGLLTTVCKLAGRLAVPRDKMWCPL